MGQYWIPVNLTKKEAINPHALASGLKLWEQLANSPGTGGALVILLAAMPDPRGGGDFDLDSSDQEYNKIAERTLGRWAGDKIAFVGDYGEMSDIQGAKNRHAGRIYSDASNSFYPEEGRKTTFVDITADVARVIEHELRGEFTGKGWRNFERTI